MSQRAKSLAQALEPFKSRLCRRVTLIVCLSILVVEVGLLLPSSFKLRDDLHVILERDGLLAVALAFASHQSQSLDALLEKSWESLRRHNIEGIAVYGEDGELLAVHGVRPQLSPAGTSVEPGQESQVRRDFPDRVSSYEILWPRQVTDLPFTVTARLSTESIRRELWSFAGRIGGLVLIISLFVSVVTVAFLGQSILTPLLAIHRNLTAARKDPANAERYKIEFCSNDEIGEAVSALNALLDRLSAVRRSDIREREQRFRDFAAASGDYFWEMNENLRFSYFSNRFAEVTGVDERELLGKTREETGIPGVDPLVWQQHLDDLHNHRPFRDFTHPREKADGQVVWLAISGNSLFDEAGRFKGYRGTGRDITSEMETQKALQSAKEVAESANRTKSEFLANISHELRTPLNAIIGFSEIMLNTGFKSRDDDRHKGYLEDINGSAQHLLALINDILDLSKIEAGAEELDEDVIDVEDLVQSVLRVVKQRADKAGVGVELYEGEQLPFIRADERKLKQALLNLLVNAIKFTEQGGKVTLKIWCRPDSGYVFQISDTGIGMAPEDIPKALRQFGQVDSDLNRKYEGTGLGLPLTKSLVELHQGSLDLQSKLGEGTTATVRLPAARIVDAVEGTREGAA